MSENLRKLIGVAVMAAIVVVGVVATNGDDSDFVRTRNVAFGLPKGAGLGAQIQQPGDAENDLVIAMAAAAKCEEGRVLVSTGDPVSPWRCDVLISDLARVGGRIGEESPILRGSDIPCHFIEVLVVDSSWTTSVRRAAIRGRTEALFGCLQQWAVGRSVSEVETVLTSWANRRPENRVMLSGTPKYCDGIFSSATLATQGNTVMKLNVPDEMDWLCPDTSDW